MEGDLSFAKRETYKKLREGETDDELSITVDVGKSVLVLGFPKHHHCINIILCQEYGSQMALDYNY